jgi:hypothetical protein
MPTFTAKFTVVWEQLIDDSWSLTGKTVTYLSDMAKLVNANQYHDQIIVLESNLSAQQLSWAPIGVSAQGSLLMFQADRPCDIRTSPSATELLSGVQMLYLAGYISNIYVTTGSYPATTIRLIAAGGSSAELSTTLPLP